MKKFRKVLDGLTTSAPAGVGGGAATPLAPGTVPRELDVRETLVSDNFQVCKTTRHGFPFQPTALAFDPIQKVLAIGCRAGGMRILGRPGVDCHCQHESGAAVLQLQFLINEGALVTACADDTLHLWNLRQKHPAVLHSLKFNRERITFCHVPFQSKWLYVGTERGNTHIVNIESFILSGYVIMWNKAIELSTKTHPGPVVHLSDRPRDEAKLLIAFESGTVVQWDLRAKKADFRIQYDEAIHSVSWHHEGKLLMCSHADGSLTTWNMRNTTKPFQVTFPHGKTQKDSKKTESCKPIPKVEFKTSRSSEPFIVFSGGLSYDKAGKRPALTIMHGKSVTVLEMDHPIVDFLVLCETPYPNEVQEPYAVAVLLEKDFIMVDLTQSNFPVFENPYPMDIHVSPVTCTAYFTECPADLIPVLYSLGIMQKKQTFSHKEWPVSGGAAGAQTEPEIILTGHADGSVKFWDASAMTLKMLYKVKTCKVFEKPKVAEGRGSEVMEEDPYVVQSLIWCPHSQLLCVVGFSAYAILYRFNKHDATAEIVPLEVYLQSETEDSVSPASADVHPATVDPRIRSPQPFPGNPVSTTVSSVRDSAPHLKVKMRAVRMPAGYQAQLVIQILTADGEPSQQITGVDVNSAYGLLALGCGNNLVLVDYLQKSLLFCMNIQELHSDPYLRVRSPHKIKQFSTDHFSVRGLANFCSDSKKRIRTPNQSLTELSDNPVPPELERSRSPTSVPHCVSPPNDPGCVPEPASAVRASHYSSVLYLLDSVKGPGRKLSLPTDLKPDLDHVNGQCSSAAGQSMASAKLPGKLSGATGATGPEAVRLGRRGPGRPPFRKAQSAACMEISLPVSHSEGYASRRAMLQQLHGVSMYSHDEHHGTAYSWSERESRESSFSRSRSSSISSVDREAKESVTALHFMESFARKTDAAPSPSLWVGTSLGVVLVLAVSASAGTQENQQDSVTMSPSGTVLMVKGSVLRFASLDFNGSLIHSPYEVWQDPHLQENPERGRRCKLAVSRSSSQEVPGEGHLVVVCTEKQAKVFLMPAQTCLHAHSITESSFVLCADVVSICNSVCLACFCANGHIMTLSLPSLRPLLDGSYLPLTDTRIARTFCFAGGQALYLDSPTEIQRITYSQEICDNLQELLGELFIPLETPEVQNRGFLKGFFGSSVQTLDREELFGEAAAGKASRSLAQHIPGQASVEVLRGGAGGVVGELAKARLALDERGQRLGELEERTSHMMSSAETFSKHAHELMLKCKDKKWYQF
ncbi:syntaxin-binding protein 5-like isoform X2 [Brienomyrus brachyistius]|uniref:syntaxin-binding protein 5-like isoform X2 n=1 Tax=Brienomyrus brachyistius TaxID=42636 RepID=UPI0020B1875C|nr:syntaxin-binding protein 5-like isoform X2 [Brienomyrus brachyistius]